MGEILQFPGLPADRPERPPGEALEPLQFPGVGADAPEGSVAPVAEFPDGMSEELRKAIGIIESGLPFVIVGCRPTEKGCDFYTSVVGDAEVLGPAAAHLAPAVNRALVRAGYKP